MRLMQSKFVSRHYDELAVKAVAVAEDELLGKDHREFTTDERRHQASAGNALPDGSYPIPDKDSLRRAAILARSGHGNAAAARRLIARRARELGVSNPLDESDDVKKGSSDEGGGGNAEFLGAVQTAMSAEPEAVKEAEPDVTKEPEPEDKPGRSRRPKGKKPKKLPPWLNKPSGDDEKCSDTGSSGACKSVSDHLWTGVEGTSDIVCTKCHTTPAQAAGVTAPPDGARPLSGS